MNQIEKGSSLRHHKVNTIILAVILIAAGLVIFAHKQGYVNEQAYNILISWQMLLVVLGVWSVVRRNWYSGVLLIGIGAFFLIPMLTGAGAGWARTYWPLSLVLLGILIIIRMIRGGKKDNGREAHHHDQETSYNTEDGFVVSENFMGAVRHIVLDPVFKGARIRNSFGGTVLDLRHTTLADSETFIDIDCTCGGIEIFVPNGWTVVSNIHPMLAGCDDKRFKHGGEPDLAHKLILRGRITLGGIEIKD